LIRQAVPNVSPYPREAYGTTQGTPSAGDIVRHWPARFLDRYRVTDTTAWDRHQDYSIPQLRDDMCMLQVVVDVESGYLQRVFWEFEDDLPTDAKVIMLVRLDKTQWNTYPHDVNAADPTLSQADLFWGKISTDSSGASDELRVYEYDGANASQPQITNDIQIRFYFDLGDANGREAPMLDTVGVEMVPEGSVF
jgi:hypothetical protein